MGERTNQAKKASEKRIGDSLRPSRRTKKSSINCYFCESPHMARDCRKKSKLLIRKEDKETNEERKMGSLQLIDAIKDKVEIPKTKQKWSLFVEAKIQGHVVKVLLDTGAKHNFFEVKEENSLGIPYKKKQGWVMEVNAKAGSIFRVARNVELCLGEWHGPFQL